MKQKRYSLYLLFWAVTLCPIALKAQVQVITTVVGNGYGSGTGTGGYTGDNGLAINAELNSCTGVTVDGAGNIYVADKDNNVVRKVNPSGIITTFAGNGTAGYGGNGGAATAARLNQPFSVAADVAGNIYIADFGNNTVRIVSPAGVINNYAGNTTAGYSGDGLIASAAKLNGPQGLATDGMGNLYIADAANNVVRKVDIAGMISTVAGTGFTGYSGDNGDATVAQLHNPTGVATDAAGNLYIADNLNSVVRKVDTSGIITTYAGTGVYGNTGDGGMAVAARLSFPAGVSVDGAGNLFIADQGNSAIRKVTSSGTISRFAGTYTNGYTGDHGAASAAELSSPKNVYADGWGRVFIADYDNNVIRVVQSSTAVPAVPYPGSVSVFPNPSNGVFTVTIPKGNEVTVTVTDVLGKTVATQQMDHTATIDMAQLPAGTYLLQLTGTVSYKEKVTVIR